MGKFEIITTSKQDDSEGIDYADNYKDAVEIVRICWDRDIVTESAQIWMEDELVATYFTCPRVSDDNVPDMPYVLNQDNCLIDFEAAMNLADSDIMSEIDIENPQEFIEEYARLHEEVHGEEFAPYANGGRQ